MKVLQLDLWNRYPKQRQTKKVTLTRMTEHHHGMEILLYISPCMNRKDIIRGRVPVQVKGRIIKHFSGDRAKFSVEVADLKKYRNDGVIFCKKQYARLINTIRCYLFRVKKDSNADSNQIN